MKWFSFSILTASLLATNVLVNANVDTSSLSSGLANYADLPDGFNDLITRIKPEQFSQLPTSAQQLLSRETASAQNRLRQEAINRNPLANGSIPINSTALPAPSAVTDSITSSSSPAVPNSTTSSTSSTTSATSNTSMSTGIDPLTAAVSYMSGQAALNQSADIATLESANRSQINLWKSHSDAVFDKLTTLKANYSQLNSVFGNYADVLESMASKLPATIPSCVRPAS